MSNPLAGGHAGESPYRHDHAAVSKNPLEDWFIKNEPVEIEVAGVRLKVREIPAGLYMHLVSQADRNNKFDTDAYINSLVKEMVIVPEFTDRDLARLKPGIKAKLMKELEILLGVSPEALKTISSGRGRI